MEIPQRNDHDCPFGSNACPKLDDFKEEVDKNFKEIKTELNNITRGLVLIALFLAAQFGVQFLQAVLP